MKDIVHFEPLRTETFYSYIKTGTKAYNQHYMHLWPDGDTAPYIQTSFTIAILKKELMDINTQLFLIHRNKECVGILKLITDAPLEAYAEKEAMYLDKIYITKEASGEGIGTKALQFTLLWAKAAEKKVLWLAAMQKGPALNFYKKNGFSIHSTTEIKFKQAIKAEKPMFIMIKKID
ncbi:MAG: GNAT superfamily N-acetyltransferase [Maribacter sp.]|jgi:GNAT superfamily N-acetyltransferase|tara:strand:+ start:834 stop:1364 length:531 start_codon:yes stop_codon:yes gene_type:complete